MGPCQPSSQGVVAGVCVGNDLLAFTLICILYLALYDGVAVMEHPAMPSLEHAAFGVEIAYHAADYFHAWVLSFSHCVKAFWELPPQSLHRC